MWRLPIKNYEGIPIWVAIEVWDFGMMSMLYSGMKVQHQDKIAEKYGAPSGHDFSKWLRSLNFIRNVCAHHSRLWNINVLERAPVPHYEHWQKINNSRPFFYFCLMQKLLAVISPNSTWNKRFDTIVESFPEPENNAIKISEFGVVDNWESWPVWGLKWEPTRTQQSCEEAPGVLRVSINKMFYLSITLR